MAFGSGKKVEALEAENARLNQWIAHLQGTDAVTLAAEVEAARANLASLQQAATEAQRAATAAQGDERLARSAIVEHEDTAALQEAGFYVFNHPLDDAVAYKDALTTAHSRMKDMIRAGLAVQGDTNWQVNNSAAQGRKLVKDFSTLMLRAYNSEADALVRALRPHALPSAKSRLDKSAMAIERLGKLMSIRIAPDYHRLRFYELELMADYLVKKQEEKEAERERRAALRDQQKAAAEMKAALEKLRKEQDHYKNLIARLDPASDPEAYATAQAKLMELGASIDGVEQRAANIRTGHVYVISNVGAFGPDMVKIGMTRRLDPYDRVVELGDASVPFRFDVHAMVFHEDAVTLETHLHQALAEKKVNRINPRREFFYATPSEVRGVLAQYAGAHLVEYRDQPEALEWYASGAVPRQTPGPAAEADGLTALEDAVSDALYADMDVDGDEDGDRLVEPSEALDQIGVAETSLGDSVANAVDVPAGLALSETSMGSDATDAIVTAMTADEPDLASARVASEALPAADWYPDPRGLARLRYWDGTGWTDHVAD
jgi:hypothetical protein